MKLDQCKKKKNSFNVVKVVYHVATFLCGVASAWLLATAILNLKETLCNTEAEASFNAE